LLICDCSLVTIWSSVGERNMQRARTWTNNYHWRRLVSSCLSSQYLKLNKQAHLIVIHKLRYLLVITKITFHPSIYLLAKCQRNANNTIDDAK